MSRARKEYRLQKSVVLRELSMLSTDYVEKFTLSDLAREIGLKPNKIYQCFSAPVTKAMGDRFVEFFKSYGVDLTLDYLCRKTPFKNISAFENSSIYKNRVKQLEFLHSIGFNYQLGAVALVYGEQFKQMSRREKFELQYLIEWDMQEYLYDNDYIENGGLFPIDLDKIDFNYYQNGLDGYSIEFKHTSIKVNYVFHIIDNSSIKNGTSNLVYLDFQEFDDYMSVIQKSIYEITNKLGYLA